MFKDGTYSAWFKSPLGDGAGVVEFTDGTLRARDSILLYDGTYETSGDNLKVVMRSRRHSPGQASIFGVDEFQLSFDGTVLGNTIVCRGTADVAPGVTVEVTLIPCNEATDAEPPPVPKLDASRLPTLPKLSRGR